MTLAALSFLAVTFYAVIVIRWHNKERRRRKDALRPPLPKE